MASYFKQFLISIAVFVATISAYAQPAGIFVLDSNQGQYRDANIRDYSFVDGFVWRTSWVEMETSQGVYNYEGLDHIVRRLDSINKKLTILFGAYSVEPSYIASQPGVTTYTFTNPITNSTTARAVPYDGYLLQRFRLFLSSLSNHQVYSLTTRSMVALKEHPVLSNIATNIPGLGAIRNVNGLNTSLQSSLPNYSRAMFVDSLIVSMKIQTDNFPTKYVFIPSYKNVDDATSSPSLADYVKAQLLSTFDGVQNPKISFWQENLAGFKDGSTDVFTGLPTTTFATPMLNLENKAYSMFQMLQGWTTPFLDPAKTANSTPFDAMCYAYNTFGTSYFEVYVSDIDNVLYQQSFSDWKTEKCNTVLSAETLPSADELSIFHLPSSCYLSLAGVGNVQDAAVSVFNMRGQKLLDVRESSIIDISSLSKDVYILAVKRSNRTRFFKFIKDD